MNSTYSLPVSNAPTDPRHRRSALPCLVLAAAALGLGLTPARAASPTLLPNASTYLAGEDIVVAFANGPGSPKDWIGVYPPDATPGPTPSTNWRYVDDTRSGNQGLTEGTITFPGGLNLAGDWVAYFLLNDGYTIAATNTFKVVDPGSTLVRLPSRTYTAGQKIEVSFKNGPANPKDWIGIYKEGQTPGPTPSTLWAYGDNTKSGDNGLAEGTVTFATGLAEPGNYLIHFLLNDGYDILATETFTVTAATGTAPRILSLSPADGSSNQPPILRFSAFITNGTFQLVPSTVVLKLDGSVVPATVTPLGELTTVAYTEGLVAPAGSTHTWLLTATDNATPPNTITAQSITTVAARYYNVTLPSPIYFENFDALAEGALPAGWTSTGYAAAPNEAIDFGDLGSAAYSQWTTVAADRFTGSFVTYGNPDNPAGWGTDYRRVLTANPFNVLNGVVLDGPLASGRFLLGNSGYHNSDAGQFLTLVTRDYNLTGKTNVHVAFKSLWEQNQDSLAALEYSIDKGASWLPVLYLLHGPDIVTIPNEVTGETSIDVDATFNTARGDIAVVTDDQGNEIGGTYGAFIAAPITPALAPFIQARVDDDPSESKRVEFHPLPKADNQASVRFRFVHAGTDSWYWGIDDFGLYSISNQTTPPGPLTVQRTAGQIVVSFQGTLQASDSALGPWTDVPGAASPYSTTPTAAARFFRSR